MKHAEANLSSQEERYRKFSELGDPLEELSLLDWESFRDEIEKAIERSEEDKSKGVPSAYDSVFMFKILFLQRLFNMSDGQTEFMISDSLSFMSFLGLRVDDKVPDAKTIGLYHDRLSKGCATEELFKRLDEQIQKTGLLVHKKPFIDTIIATIPPASSFYS